MKSLWRRIGKKSLRLAGRNGAGDRGCNDSSPVGGLASLTSPEEETIPDTEIEDDTGGGTEAEIECCTTEDGQTASSPVTLSMEAVCSQAARSFDKTIPEEEEEYEEGEKVYEDGRQPVAFVPATSEENLDGSGSSSYCYGSQFTFHGGLYGYPTAATRRRMAAVPVIKGFTMTDVDFPLYFSSYDIPVVSASRHASFTRRTRLVRLHNRYTSMPVMHAQRSVPRTLTEVGESSVVQGALPEKHSESAESG